MSPIPRTPSGRPTSPVCFEKYVGLPWANLGRDWGGVDCWGLRWLIFLYELGIRLPSFSDDYTTVADQEIIQALISNNLPRIEEVERGKEKMFDGVLMRVGSSEGHVGTVVRPGLLIHIGEGRTSVIQEYRTGILRHRVVGFYRHWELR